MKVYRKVVRDRIPEIIAAAGRKAEVQTLDEPEFAQGLGLKLREEVDEYLESGRLEELADLLEVIYSLAQLQGIAPEALETIRLNKRAERGGFEKRLFLVGVRDESDPASPAL